MSSRSARLAEELRRRILLLDGATGTALASRDLTTADYGGEALFGCHEALVLHRPDVVLDLHRGYLAAGADIVETDTFGATPVVLAEYGLADHCREINRRAAEMGVVKQEIWPAGQMGDDQAIREFVTREAWGHHASCSCPIGADGDPLAVLDSRFRVRGARRLRVVDASVFPRIPGVFIVTNIYMVAEKAGDVIAEDQRGPARPLA